MAEKTSLENKHLCKHVSFCYNYHSFFLALHKKKNSAEKAHCAIEENMENERFTMCVHIVVKPLNLEISCRH